MTQNIAPKTTEPKSATRTGFKWPFPKTTLAVTPVALLFAAAYGTAWWSRNIDAQLEKAASDPDPVMSVPTMVRTYDTVMPRYGYNVSDALYDAARFALKNKNYKAFDMLFNSSQTYYREEAATQGRAYYDPVKMFRTFVSTAVYESDLATLDHLAARYPALMKETGQEEFMTAAERTAKEAAIPMVSFFLKNGFVSDQEHPVLERAVDRKNFAFADALIARGMTTDFNRLKKTMGGENAEGSGLLAFNVTCGKFNECFTLPKLEWMKKNNIDLHGHNFETTMESVRRGDVDALKFLMDNGAGTQAVKNQALKEAFSGAYSEKPSSNAAIVLLHRGAHADEETVKLLNKIVPEANLVARVLASQEKKAPGRAFTPD